MAGPQGIDPSKVLNSQLSAAELFANSTGAIRQKDVTGDKKDEPAKKLDVEDKSDLTTLAKTSSREEVIDVVDSSVLQQKQTQDEAYQTGSVGGHGKGHSKKSDAPREESQQQVVEQADDEAAQIGLLQKLGKQVKGKKIAEEEQNEEVQERTNYVFSKETAEGRTSQVLSNAAGNLAVSDVNISPEKINAEKIKATYNFATRPNQYTPPVHQTSVEEIFSAENLKAKEALPVVRGMEGSAIPVNAEMLLEPAPPGKGTPIAIPQFEDNGLHGGSVEAYLS